jgi:hypothetical protein
MWVSVAVATVAAFAGGCVGFFTACVLAAAARGDSAEIDDQLHYVLDAHGLWSEDGTYTFPDGTVVDKVRW